MILIDYYSFRDIQERQNLMIEHESESRTNRFECLVHHSFDEQQSIFELHSWSCALRRIVELLSMKEHSSRSCENTLRKRAMWISIHWVQRSHSMRWMSFAMSSSNRCLKFSRWWLHTLYEANRDIVRSYQLNDVSQSILYLFWCSCWMHTAWILERWIACSHLR
jgi:hypothetical protein